MTDGLRELALTAYHNKKEKEDKELLDQKKKFEDGIKRSAGEKLGISPDSIEDGIAVFGDVKILHSYPYDSIQVMGICPDCLEEVPSNRYHCELEEIGKLLDNFEPSLEHKMKCKAQEPLRSDIQLIVDVIKEVGADLVEAIGKLEKKPE